MLDALNKSRDNKTLYYPLPFALHVGPLDVGIFDCTSNIDLMFFAIQKAVTFKGNSKDFITT